LEDGEVGEGEGRGEQVGRHLLEKGGTGRGMGIRRK